MAPEAPEAQRLILLVASALEPARLSAALQGGEVAAVVIDGPEAPSGLIEAAQDEGAAALLARQLAEGARGRWPTAPGADGLHVDGDFEARVAAVDQRPEGLTIGATAATRHEAMTLGEAGADYVWFGTTATLLEPAAELACWWTRLFEVPAVLAGPADDASLAQMIATRVEFIAVNVFQSQWDPAERVASILGRLREGTVTS